MTNPQIPRNKRSIHCLMLLGSANERVEEGEEGEEVEILSGVNVERDKASVEMSKQNVEK
jgi:hypothetical protein